MEELISDHYHVHNQVVFTVLSLILLQEAFLGWKIFLMMTTADHTLTRRRKSQKIRTSMVTSKQVAVAGTNSKDIKAVLKSRSDIPACLAVGRILADRAREADVYTASYTPRERDKFEGKIRAVVQSLIDSGIDIKVFLD
ncbi:uncharacterized protein LOC111381056 isoform X3 [Olea europaea var. sylvestris]|uniref:uncharacterized protein LOC111381056 isoform X3 n=1 Tax=Olea europaea var. sylvestris TaxID=158386 RepID=UPI000C1CE89F|nr:uncharacterized protein LOC111381056 isoform X3 [Olea europaea var. sylvestris]